MNEDLRQEILSEVKRASKAVSVMTQDWYHDAYLTRCLREAVEALNKIEKLCAPKAKP